MARKQTFESASIGQHIFFQVVGHTALDGISHLLDENLKNIYDNNRVKWHLALAVIITLVVWYGA